MTVMIADVEFDRVEYDADADVLYLHVGDPARAVDYNETPEGHAVRLDRNGELIGLTLVRPKRLLERDGELRVTMPVSSAVPAAELNPHPERVGEAPLSSRGTVQVPQSCRSQAPFQPVTAGLSRSRFGSKGENPPCHAVARMTLSL